MITPPRRTDDGRRKSGWLALHIRRLRKWFGTRGISQKELADITGVFPRRLRSLESAHCLPKSVDSLLRIAIGLNTTMDNLIAPGYREHLRQLMENRGNDGHSGQGECQPLCPIIAVCYRSPYLALAVVHDGDSTLPRRRSLS